MVQKEPPPSPPTEEQEAEFERAQAHAKVVRRQRERLQEELARLDKELASATQSDPQDDEQSLASSEEQAVFSPASNDPVTKQEKVIGQGTQERRERGDLYWFRRNANDDDDEGFASRTPAMQARVSKPAAVRFEPYKPSPQLTTPQDRQRIQDFEEYRMFCQMRETQALFTPAPFSQATSMSRSPPGELS